MIVVPIIQRISMYYCLGPSNPVYEFCSAIAFRWLNFFRSITISSFRLSSFSHYSTKEIIASLAGIV